MGSLVVHLHIGSGPGVNSVGEDGRVTSGTIQDLRGTSGCNHKNKMAPNTRAVYMFVGERLCTNRMLLYIHKRSSMGIS